MKTQPLSNTSEKLEKQKRYAENTRKINNVSNFFKQILQAQIVPWMCLKYTTKQLLDLDCLYFDLPLV